jgi:hypothetical protein
MCPRYEGKPTPCRRLRDPAEVIAFLQFGDDGVGTHDDRSQDAGDDRGCFPQPPPDQVAAAGLGQPGSEEQRDSASDGHTVDLARCRAIPLVRQVAGHCGLGG